MVNIEVDFTIKGEVAVLHVKGDVTATAGEALLRAYNDEQVAAMNTIVLDFADNCYINSGGIAYLIDIAARSMEKKQQIRVTGLSDHFQKVFQMIGLTGCMMICSDMHEALSVKSE